MSRINVLDKHTAELIAAGEVVERPASVIKELIENSIDAGAKVITVEIKNGGNTYMRVTDDGNGIHKDDIRKAFVRHATSKIATESDLDAISTLGFRGEALASVSAVAKVELLTRTPDSDFGMQYQIEGGEELFLDEAGCPVGTTIIVRDLFFNTPARLKFLKKDVTEGNAIASVIDRVALSHPEVSFKFIREGKQALLTPGDSILKSTIYSVLGKDFHDSIIPVEYEMGGIKVSGFISKPFSSRANRNLQFFYINGRYVKTRTAIAALEEAYKSSIMVGKFPSCVLNIELSASEVDVNVHPSKIEVRFTNERPVFSAVYYGVKSALNQDVSRVQIQTPTPKVEPKQPEIEQIKIESFTAPKVETVSQPVVTERPFANVVSQKQNNDIFKVSDVKETYNAPPVVEKVEPAPKATEPQPEVKQEVEFRFIGQLFSTYILVECDDKLLLIDKHASHERIIYEELKATIKHEGQLLMTPQKVTLSFDEYDALISSLDRINELGFEIEEYGSKDVLVRALPMALVGEDVEELISEIAGKLVDNKKDFSPAFLDWLYHSVACRAAIKAGNKSSDLELVSLARKVLNSDNIRFCPHGRPTVIELSKYEIEKRFGRT